jgi:hypothetical protein
MKRRQRLRVTSAPKRKKTVVQADSEHSDDGNSSSEDAVEEETTMEAGDPVKAEEPMEDEDPSEEDEAAEIPTDEPDLPGGVQPIGMAGNSHPPIMNTPVKKAENLSRRRSTSTKRHRLSWKGQHASRIANRVYQPLL